MAPAALQLSAEMLEAGVELVPIPAAHLIREAEGWRFEAANRAYRQTALGVSPDRSILLDALAPRLDRFMASDQEHEQFDWSTGEAVAGRHYRVGFARMGSGSRRCTVTLIDETSRLLTEHSLRREMTIDSLTGLPNREGFGDLIDAALQAEERHAVLVVDLARFGRINACMGSLVGDELLITVARRIKGALRARDALARIGGDEFGVLMAVDTSTDEATTLADRIRNSLTLPFRLTDFEVGVDCAIGVAFAGKDDESSELVRHAQFAIKRAKASGQTETYQPQAFSIARVQFAMETALRRAIEDRRLRLDYQPIRDLSDGRIVSFEALARWRDETGREHSPSDFIPVAEETGLIVPLGRWAIDEAARTLAGWDVAARGLGLRDCGVRMAVNLSAIQLQRDTVPAVFEAALAAAGLTGDRFTLELTESAIVGDPDGIARTMAALKALGATLAMDDFGTGYSNLAYLQQLPIDILKIDRSFVSGMLEDRDKLAIVRAVLSLAQALGKQTTAEGVETAALGQTLAALGCTFGQGYFFAPPLAASAAWAMIAPTTESAISSTLG